jgi:hypothetical protein
MGLVGAESKNVEAALLKVQSAMALSQGLQQLGEARDSFKQLGAVAKSVFTGMKGAIAATGIGVLLIALGAIAANWDSIKGAIGGVTEKQQALTRETQKDLDLQKSKLARLNQQDNALRLQGATEREILVLKIAQTKQVADAGLKQIEAAKRNRDEQIEATAISRENLSNILKFIEYPITTILKAVDKVRSVMGQKSTLSKDFLDFQSGLIFNEEKVRKEADKGIRAIREENQKVIAEQQALEVQLRGIDKQAAADRLAIKKQATLDLEAQRADEAEKNQLAYQNRIANELNEDQQIALLDAEEKRLAKERADKQLADESELRVIKNGLDAEQAKIDAQRDKDDFNRKQSLNKQKLQMAISSIGVLQDAMSLFTAKNEKDARNQFKINKALSLASAIANTALAVTGALTAGGNPIKLATGMQFIEAGIAAASGGVAIAKIAGTQFGGTGGGGGGSSPSPSGGGGGGSSSQNGGAGGSGIVIFRYLTSQNAGLQISGGTITTSGNYTIHTFTSTGTTTVSIL